MSTEMGVVSQPLPRATPPTTSHPAPTLNSLLAEPEPVDFLMFSFAYGEIALPFRVEAHRFAVAVLVACPDLQLHGGGGGHGIDYRFPLRSPPKPTITLVS